MKPFLLLLILLPLVAFSQLSEYFDDGNLTKNPAWSGTRNQFVVNVAKQLQLYDSVAGKAWLTTPFQMLPQTEWQVWVKAAFSPSSKNFIRIFLAADSPDITNVSKGYYLQLGEAGSNDAIELFRKTGDTVVSICRGTEGLLSKAFAVRIKVLRDSLGNWQLFADPAGGDSFRKEAEGKDNRYRTSSCFGLYCQYTRSNAKKVFFDDIYAGTPQVDTLPPVLDSILVTSDSTLLLLFSESLDSLSAMQTKDYLLPPDAGKLVDIALSPDNKNVTLTFTGHLRRNQAYKLPFPELQTMPETV